MLYDAIRLSKVECLFNAENTNKLLLNLEIQYMYTKNKLTFYIFTFKKYLYHPVAFEKEVNKFKKYAC